MIIDDHLKPHILYKISKMYDKWDKIIMENNENEFNKEFNILTSCDMKQDKEKLLEFALLMYITKDGGVDAKKETTK